MIEWLISMPWYSYTGFIICLVGCMWISCDFYRRYKMKQIPFMHCIQSIEQYLTKNNKKVTRFNGEIDVLDAVFFARESPYSPNMKEIILYVLEACRNGEINLFGKQGILNKVYIEPSYIDKDKIVFIDGSPVLHDGFNNVIFTDLMIEKNEAMKWTMKNIY